MKKQLALGVLVAAVCLWFAFRGINFNEMWEVFKTARPTWLLAALAAYSTGYALRVFRWRILMNPIKEIPAQALTAPLLLGFFANNILPFRMGELVRAHVTGRKFDVSRTASLGTILLERLYDTVSFLTTFVVSTWFFDFPAWVERGALALGSACFLVVVGLGIMLRHQQWMRNWIDRSRISAHWKARLADLIENFSTGVSGMRSLSAVTATLSLSLVIWVLEGTQLFLIAHAFALPLVYAAAFFLLFFMGLSVTLPQAPGYVGTIEFFGVSALTALGFAKDHALPVVLAIHGFQFMFILIAGFWALGHEGLSIGKLLRREALSD